MDHFPDDSCTAESYLAIFNRTASYYQRIATGMASKSSDTESGSELDFSLFEEVNYGTCLDGKAVYLKHN